MFLPDFAVLVVTIGLRIVKSSFVTVQLSWQLLRPQAEFHILTTLTLCQKKIARIQLLQSRFSSFKLCPRVAGPIVLWHGSMSVLKTLNVYKNTA